MKRAMIVLDKVGDVATLISTIERVLQCKVGGTDPISRTGPISGPICPIADADSALPATIRPAATFSRKDAARDRSRSVRETGWSVTSQSRSQTELSFDANFGALLDDVFADADLVLAGVLNG